MNRSLRFSVLPGSQYLMGLVLIGATSPAALGGNGPEATDEPLAPFLEKNDTVERRASIRQMRRDLDRISLGTASRFHRRLIRIFERELPKDVEVAYMGPLYAEGSHPSQRILGQGFTLALFWRVQKNVGIFSFWISTARTEATAAACEIDGVKLFLNVQGIGGNRSVNEPLAELGGKSVKEALKLLETPPPPERALPVDPEEVGKEDAGQPAAEKREDFERLIDLIQSQQGTGTTGCRSKSNSVREGAYDAPEVPPRFIPVTGAGRLRR